MLAQGVLAQGVLPHGVLPQAVLPQGVLAQGCWHAGLQVMQEIAVSTATILSVDCRRREFQFNRNLIQFNFKMKEKMCVCSDNVTIMLS